MSGPIIHSRAPPPSAVSPSTATPRVSSTSPRTSVSPDISYAKSSARLRAKNGTRWAHECNGIGSSDHRISCRTGTRVHVENAKLEDHVSGRPDLLHWASAVRRQIGYLGHSTRPVAFRGASRLNQGFVSRRCPGRSPRQVRAFEHVRVIREACRRASLSPPRSIRQRGRVSRRRTDVQVSTERRVPRATEQLRACASEQ